MKHFGYLAVLGLAAILAGCQSMPDAAISENESPQQVMVISTPGAESESRPRELPTAAPPVEGTGEQQAHFFSTTAHLTGEVFRMGYLLYLPERYNENPYFEWPLILFLHGAGSSGQDPSMLLGRGLPQMLQMPDENFPFIVVSPQAPNTGNGWAAYLDCLDELLDLIIDTYRVDEARIYVTGLSMGGVGSWSMALAYPERFAAMVSVSGSLIAGQMSYERVCELAQVDVWAVHGANDTTFSPIVAADTISVLQSCNGPSEVRWTLYPDTDHGSTVSRIYSDPTLYEWLLQQSR